MFAITTALLGPAVYLFSEQWVVKGAERGMRFAWHQDSGYVDLRDPGNAHAPYLTCWCALDDMTRENGTFSVLPHPRAGSRNAVFPHRREQGANDLVGYEGDDPGELVEMPAGSVAVFQSTSLHRSGANTTRVRAEPTSRSTVENRSTPRAAISGAGGALRGGGKAGVRRRCGCRPWSGMTGTLRIQPRSGSGVPGMETERRTERRKRTEGTKEERDEGAVNERSVNERAVNEVWAAARREGRTGAGGRRGARAGRCVVLTLLLLALGFAGPIPAQSGNQPPVANAGGSRAVVEGDAVFLEGYGFRSGRRAAVLPVDADRRAGGAVEVGREGHGALRRADGAVGGRDAGVRADGDGRRRSFGHGRGGGAGGAVRSRRHPHCRRSWKAARWPPGDVRPAGPPDGRGGGRRRQRLRGGCGPPPGAADRHRGRDRDGGRHRGAGLLGRRRAGDGRSTGRPAGRGGGRRRQRLRGGCVQQSGAADRRRGRDRDGGRHRGAGRFGRRRAGDGRPPGLSQRRGGGRRRRHLRGGCGQQPGAADRRLGRDRDGGRHRAVGRFGRRRAGDGRSTGHPAGRGSGRRRQRLRGGLGQTTGCGGSTPRA